MDEQILVTQARAGDTDAFAALLHPHIATAYRTALAITSSADLAQDAVQEGMIEAYKSLDRFQIDLKFRPWFMKLVVHRALNQNRRGRRFALLPAVPEQTAPDEGPEESMLSKEQREQIWQMVGNLDPDHRAVVVLHYYQDLPIADVAGMLEIPPGTVKSRLYHARQQIKRALAGTPCRTQAAPIPAQGGVRLG